MYYVYTTKTRCAGKTGNDIRSIYQLVFILLNYEMIYLNYVMIYVSLHIAGVPSGTYTNGYRYNPSVYTPLRNTYDVPEKPEKFTGVLSYYVVINVSLHIAIVPSAIYTNDCPPN